MESTGIYWIGAYRYLEDIAEVVVGNPRDIKNAKKKKTDIKDAIWIAQLCLNGLIEPSAVPTRKEEILRDLVRARVKFTQQITQNKNRVHKLLDKANIGLSKELSDIFGKSGRIIVEGIISGFGLDEIMEMIKSKKIKRKKEQIKEAIRCSLYDQDAFLIKMHLEIIDTLNEKISEIDAKLIELLKDEEMKLKILKSLDGVGMVSAVIILAEVMDIKRFPAPKNLVSWSGLKSE